MQQKNQHIILIVTLMLLLISSLSIYTLKQKSIEQEKINSVESYLLKKNIDNEQKRMLEETTISESTQEVLKIDSFDTLFARNLSNNALIKEINQLLNTNYQNDYLKAQTDILEALNQHHINIEESGYLFLPQTPAQYTKGPNDQINVPLIIQKNPKWRNLSYGTDGSNQLGENGCAIVTLAMLDSYYQNETVEPKDILTWSQNRYYVHNEGTSWQIFYDFAIAHQYQFENFGNNFDRAMEAVQQGRVVIASVKSGYFTSTGHIFIIRGYDGQNVYINDPNDDAKKMHSVQPIDQSILLEDGLNYWTLYR